MDMSSARRDGRHAASRTQDRCRRLSPPIRCRVVRSLTEEFEGRDHAVQNVHAFSELRRVCR